MGQGFLRVYGLSPRLGVPVGSFLISAGVAVLGDMGDKTPVARIHTRSNFQATCAHHSVLRVWLDRSDDHRRSGVLCKRRSFRCVQRERLSSQCFQESGSGAANDPLFILPTRLAAARHIGIGGAEEASGGDRLSALLDYAGQRVGVVQNRPRPCENPTRRLY